MPKPLFDCSLSQVAATLHISPAGQALCTGWEKAMPVPWKHTATFLQPGFIVEAGKAVTLTDEMIRDLVRFAGRIIDADGVRSPTRRTIQGDQANLNSRDTQHPH